MCVFIYIHIYKNNKWAFCLKCAQVAADKRNLKLRFKFQLYLQSNPSRRGFVLPFHLYAGCAELCRIGTWVGNAVALLFVLNNPDFTGLKGKEWLWLLLAGQAGPRARGELALLTPSDCVMQKYQHINPWTSVCAGPELADALAGGCPGFWIASLRRARTKP